jgi:hypothetical protein
MQLCSADSHITSVPHSSQLLQISAAASDSSAVAAAVAADNPESRCARLQLWSTCGSALTCSADMSCGDGWEYYGCGHVQAQWVGGEPNLVLVGGGDGIVLVDARAGSTV